MRYALHLLITILLCTISLSATDMSVKMLYLHQKVKHPPVLSNIIEKPDDLGLAGAKMALEDSQKSAQFMNQKYSLDTKVSYKEDELLKAFENYVDNGGRYVVVNVQNLPLSKTYEAPKK